LPRSFTVRDLSAPGERLARAVQKLRQFRGTLVLVPLLAGAVLYANRGTLWNRELSAARSFAAPETRHSCARLDGPVAQERAAGLEAPRSRPDR